MLTAQSMLHDTHDPREVGLPLAMHVHLMPDFPARSDADMEDVEWFPLLMSVPPRGRYLECGK